MKMKLICKECHDELEVNVLPIGAVDCDMILEINTDCSCAKGAEPINQKVQEILKETLKSLEEL